MTDRTITGMNMTAQNPRDHQKPFCGREGRGGEGRGVEGGEGRGGEWREGRGGEGSGGRGGEGREGGEGRGGEVGIKLTLGISCGCGLPSLQ